MPFPPWLEGDSTPVLETPLNLIEVEIDAVKNHHEAFLFVNFAPIPCTAFVLLPGLFHALKSGWEMDPTSSMGPFPQGFLA